MSSRGLCKGADSSRLRLVSAQLNTVSASASGRVAQMRAFSKTSAAPDASTKLSSGSLKAAASAGLKRGGSGVTGVAIRLGATSTRRVSPMVFIARAAAPILAGWLVRHSTTLKFCR